MLALDDLQRALAVHRPRTLPGRRRAAVAVVVHQAGAGPEMLFIERARHPGDPWSGQMAFPGGRVDPGDADERAAAERETLEEVGLSLAGAERLGRLDDLHAGARFVAPLVLSAFVYRIGSRTTLTPNHEVADTLWVPLRALLDPGRHVGYRWGLTKWPGVCVGAPDRHVVWGLTYRLLKALFGVAGTPFPAPPD
jgi:8-oxo-dGTP pyrophosphatase MutT (NUDIX family)